MCLDCRRLRKEWDTKHRAGGEVWLCSQDTVAHPTLVLTSSVVGQSAFRNFIQERSRDNGTQKLKTARIEYPTTGKEPYCKPLISMDFEAR